MRAEIMARCFFAHNGVKYENYQQYWDKDNTKKYSLKSLFKD